MSYLRLNFLQTSLILEEDATRCAIDLARKVYLHDSEGIFKGSHTWFKTTCIYSKAVNTMDPETLPCFILCPHETGNKVGIMFERDYLWITHRIILHDGTRYGYARIQVRVKHNGERKSIGLDPFHVRSENGEFHSSRNMLSMESLMDFSF